jgi:hypothetical protein
MKRLLILLSILAGLVFIPLNNTDAASPFAVHKQAVAGIPVASSVIAVSGAISGLGVVGHYIFTRRQR